MTGARRTGPFILVTVADVQGSAPREAGAWMRVFADGFEGTIGGGALEHQAQATAREMLATGAVRRDWDQPLGPDLGQCCGGRVRLVFERGAAPPPPPDRAPVLIFGAGHVGAALARALAPLPAALTVVDERAALLAPLAPIARIVETPLPEAEVAVAPPGAGFVILTHDHALDFLIAEAALRRGDAGYVGMIGSATKRAGLVRDLRRKGVDDGALTCPIGAAGPRDRRPAVIAAAAAVEVMTALEREGGRWRS